MTLRINYGRWVRVTLTYAVLCLGAAVILLPVWLAVVSSLLPKEQAISYPPKLWPNWLHLQFGNYKRAMDAVPLGRYMFNSFMQSSIITIGQLATATLAAYAFAFMRFPLRNFLFILFLSTLMVPWEASIIPNFQTVQMMGDKLGGYILGLDSYQALTIPFLATAFGTFLMRQHFMTIPLELRDAASIDGYGHLRFLWHVVLPLSKPALGTLAVFSFLQAWNQYLWPLLVTNSDNYRTVQIGLAGLASQEIDSINIVMAGTVIALLPMLIVIVLFQRQLVRGLMSGALKG